VTRAGLKGAVAVTLGLAAVGLWRVRPSGATGPEHVARASAQAVMAAAPPREVAGQAPVARPRPAPPSEASLMTRLRDVKDADPALAVELAREGNRRFSEGEGAPERASVLIHALAAQGRSSEARGEAEDMVNRYPDSAWVREVEQFTGAHRHRNLRLGADGALESY
jgi:hypothetical protein